MVGNVWRGYIWLHGARGRKRQLRENVRQLELLNSKLAEAKEENARLQRLLGFQGTIPFVTRERASSGGRPIILSNTIYLDRGSVDGVR